MGDSYYEQPPPKDGRYVRRLLFEERAITNSFVVAHRKAQEKNQRHQYEQANFKRTELMSFKASLEGELEEITADQRPEAARILGRVIDTLETYHPFGAELLNSPQPTRQIVPRNRSEVSAVRSDIADTRNRGGDSVVAESVDTRPNTFQGFGPG